MNDVLDSECTSGCESGWTLYLEHSFLSFRGNEFVDLKGVFTEEKRAIYEDEDEDDNLSMVSDASSGPPHFREDEDYGNEDSECFYHSPINAIMQKNSGKKERIKEHRHHKVQEQPSFLDETASSSVFDFTNNDCTPTNNKALMENILDFSPGQGYSATHFERRSAFHDYFGFYQSSLSGNQLQQNQWLGGQRRE